MSTRSIRFLFTILLCTVSFAFLATPSQASVTTMSFQPNPVDLNDLDHHDVYTWRLDNIDLSGVALTGASITFKNIANWDSNSNMLFVWLLDSASHSGVFSTQDVDAGQAPVTDISDGFLNSTILNALVAGGTAKTKLFQKSFTTNPTTWTYDFTAAELQTLQAYILNGHNVALGFDPDCHFFNDGITFTLNLTPVPEFSSAVPALCLVILATAVEIRRRRRANSVIFSTNTLDS